MSTQATKVASAHKKQLIAQYGSSTYSAAVAANNAHKQHTDSLIQKYAPGGSLLQAQQNQQQRSHRQALINQYGASSYAEARSLNAQHVSYVQGLISKYAPGGTLAQAQANRTAIKSRTQVPVPTAGTFQLLSPLFDTSQGGISGFDPGSGTAGVSDSLGTTDGSTTSSGTIWIILIGLGVAAYFLLKK